MEMFSRVEVKKIKAEAGSRLGDVAAQRIRTFQCSAGNGQSVLICSLKSTLIEMFSVPKEPIILVCVCEQRWSCGSGSVHLVGHSSMRSTAEV